MTNRNVTVIVDRSVSDPGPSAVGSDAANLFVYGSLVDPRKLDEVLGYHFLGERLRARLSGFERVMERITPR